MNLAACQDMVKVGVGLHDSGDFQPHGRRRVQDSLRITASVKYETLAGFCVTEYRAVALQGADGKSFPDDIHGWICCPASMQRKRDWVN